MGFKSKFDVSGENQIRGEKAESLFSEIAISLGYEVEDTTDYDNFAKHIDKRIWNLERKENFRVQVKSIKKKSRSDSSFDYNYIWIEFANVRGDKGWIYGEFDIIAFEREHDFLIVKRIDLIELCERLVNFNDRVYNTYDAVYKIYTRQGRSDKISLVKMTDIENLENVIWLK